MGERGGALGTEPETDVLSKWQLMPHHFRERIRGRTPRLERARENHAEIHIPREFAL